MKRYYLMRMLGSTRLPYADNADEIMETEDFREYVANNGYHFTDRMSDYASGMLENRDKSSHKWSVDQVANALQSVPSGYTRGDVAYFANMVYSDFYPDIAMNEGEVLKIAGALLRDADGYEGMIFMRWIADLIGRGEDIDWSKYM